MAMGDERQYHTIARFCTKNRSSMEILDIPKTTLAREKLTQAEWMHVKNAIGLLKQVLKQRGDYSKKDFIKSLDDTIKEINATQTGKNSIEFIMDVEQQRGRTILSQPKTFICIYVGTPQTRPNQAMSLHDEGKTGASATPSATSQLHAPALQPRQRPSNENQSETQSTNDEEDIPNYVNITPFSAMASSPQQPVSSVPTTNDPATNGHLIRHASAQTTSSDVSHAGADMAAVEVASLHQDGPQYNPSLPDSQGVDERDKEISHDESAPEPPLANSQPNSSAPEQSAANFQRTHTGIVPRDSMSPQPEAYDKLWDSEEDRRQSMLIYDTLQPRQPMVSGGATPYNSFIQSLASQTSSSVHMSNHALVPSDQFSQSPPSNDDASDGELYDRLSRLIPPNQQPFEIYDTLKPMATNHTNTSPRWAPYNEGNLENSTSEVHDTTVPPSTWNIMQRPSQQLEKTNKPMGRELTHTYSMDEGRMTREPSWPSNCTRSDSDTTSQLARSKADTPLWAANQPMSLPDVSSEDTLSSVTGQLSPRQSFPETEQQLPIGESDLDTTHTRQSQQVISLDRSGSAAGAVLITGNNEQTETPFSSPGAANSHRAVSAANSKGQNSPSTFSTKSWSSLQHQVNQIASNVSPSCTLDPPQFPNHTAANGRAAVVKQDRFETAPALVDVRMDADTVEQCSWFLHLPLSLLGPAKQGQRRRYLEGLFADSGDGAWLLRYNEAKHTYIITMKYVATILHVTVPFEHGCYVLNGQHFDTIVDLLRYFSNHPISYKIATPLTNPVCCIEEADENQYITL